MLSYSMVSIISGRFIEAVPTAELEPITETYVQSDEVSDSNDVKYWSWLTSGI